MASASGRKWKPKPAPKGISIPIKTEASLPRKSESMCRFSAHVQITLSLPATLGAGVPVNLLGTGFGFIEFCQFPGHISFSRVDSFVWAVTGRSR
jgi:hypothetical protein